MYIERQSARAKICNDLPAPHLKERFYPWMYVFLLRSPPPLDACLPGLDRWPNLTVPLSMNGYRTDREYA